MPPAIRIENLSKCYQIGSHGGPDQTMLREVLAHVATAPFRRLRQARAAAIATAAPAGPGVNGHGAGTLLPSELNRLPQPIPPTEFWALKDVSFDIQQGEVVGIIGRNGAGKSTLLKILSRIVEPTTGRIEIRGRVGSLLEVGTGFHPELTGRENVFLNGAILGLTQREIKRKFDAIVDFSGVEQFIDTPVKRYSSGMYVRLAFAVAAHMDSEILIVDEVLAVGDSEFQQKCVKKIDDLAKCGRTILLVSHNVTSIEKLCTTAIILAKGRIEMQGDPITCIASYIPKATSPSATWIRTDPAPPVPHLRQASLCFADGSPCELVPNDEQIGINIEFGIPELTPNLLMSVVIKDSDGRAIFTTRPSDIGYELPSTPGIYRIRVVFPQAIFMDRDYRVQLAVFTESRVLDMQANAIRFRAVPAERTFDYVPAGRHGELFILCDWTQFEPLDS